MIQCIYLFIYLCHKIQYFVRCPAVLEPNHSAIDNGLNLSNGQSSHLSAGARQMMIYSSGFKTFTARSSYLGLLNCCLVMLGLFASWLRSYLTSVLSVDFSFAPSASYYRVFLLLASLPHFLQAPVANHGAE